MITHAPYSPTEVTLSINNLTDFDLYAEALARAGRRGRVPFVEILWDNYLHLSPKQLAETLEPVADRVALHIMWSGFVHSDEERLERVLERLAEHVDVLQPLYVSDHLTRTIRHGRYLTPPEDLDYERDRDRTCERVLRYQERIGCPLLLENQASEGPEGRGQADFATEIVRRTGCGLLFDVSNAIVAESNDGDPFSAWLPALAQGPVRAHVGGYRPDEEDGHLRDSHGDPLSPATMHAVQMLSASGGLRSICLERESNKTVDAIAEELLRLDAATHGPRAHDQVEGQARV